MQMENKDWAFGETWMFSVAWYVKQMPNGWRLPRIKCSSFTGCLFFISDPHCLLRNLKWSSDNCDKKQQKLRSVVLLCSGLPICGRFVINAEEKQHWNKTLSYCCDIHIPNSGQHENLARVHL